MKSKLKKTFTYCAAVFLMVCFTLSASAHWEGYGSKENPIEISSGADLILLSELVDTGTTFEGKYFIVAKDIDMGGVNFTPIGNEIKPFKGNFNGNGKVISNLNIDNSGQDHVGLFGYTENSSISNLGLINVNIRGKHYVGGLIGWNWGSVANCYVTGAVLGTHDVGGLIGWNFRDGAVNNCYAKGSVTGESFVGGLIGENYGIVRNSYAACNLSGTGIFGLIGNNHWGTVTNCYYDHTKYTGDGIGGDPGEVTGKMTQEMQTKDFVNALNKEQSPVPWSYVADDYPKLIVYPFPGGDGTLAAPFQISDKSDLTFLSYLVNAGTTFEGKYFIVAKDIDMGGESAGSFTPIGNNIKLFKGNFDGKGHVISNLYINTASNYVGLFGYTENGSISNLGLIDGIITGEGNFVGGLVGLNQNCSVENCYTTGTVSGEGNFVGGLIGQNGGTISNCYAAGTVSGKGDCVGGLIGQNQRGVISNSYAAGSVSGEGNFVGGLIGWNAGTISNCYYDNTKYIGDGIGVNMGSGEATGKSTVEMKTAGFEGDLGSAFKPTLNNYPLLAWQDSHVVTLTNARFDGFDVDSKIFTAQYGIGMSDKIYAIIPEGAIFVNWTNENDDEISKDSIITFTMGTEDLTFLANVKIPFSGGNGLQTTPYQISNRADLDQLAELVNAGTTFEGKYFQLTNDIDMDGESAGSFTPIGNNIKLFKGNFDGKGHVISNLYINTASNYVGLFGYTENGSISNLGLIDVNIRGKNNVGGLAGEIDGGTITNCYVTGTVSGTYNAGGLIGENYGHVTNCYAMTGVQGNKGTGGLIGFNRNSTVRNCYAVGRVSGPKDDVSALIGMENMSIVTNCYYDKTKCDRPGIEYGSGDVTGKTTAEMKSADFVSNLNGTDTAFVLTKNNYPLLYWQDSYSVTLTNGTFNGVIPPTRETTITADYAPGMTDIIYAIIPEGAIFVNWTNENDDEISKDSIITFTMGTEDLTFLANVKIPFSGGNGLQTTPYQISNRADLDQLAELVNAGTTFEGKYFQLTNDIDMGGVNFTPIGNEIKPFKGNFNGNGKVISNLYINTKSDNVGLFGYTENGSILNLGLIDGIITGNHNVGGLVGWNQNCSVENCYAVGKVSGEGNNVGGLIGGNDGGSISNCYTMGTVSGDNSVGGLIGFNYNGTISSCYIIANVSGEGNDVGGLVGWNQNYSVENCYAVGKVSGEGNNVGGLIGWSQSVSVTNCYAISTASGDNWVGGLIGSNYSTPVKNCYATGTVSGNDDVGGLIGYTRGGSVTNCYAVATVSGDNTVGGLIGSNDDATITNCYHDRRKCDQGAAYATGKTTAEMKSAKFVGALNGSDTAFVLAKNNYPVLYWQAKNTVTIEKGYFDGFEADSGITTAEYAPYFTDTIYAPPAPAGYEFLHWMCDETILTTDTTYFFTMGTTDTKFTAVYKATQNIGIQYVILTTKKNRLIDMETNIETRFVGPYEVRDTLAMWQVSGIPGTTHVAGGSTVEIPLESDHVVFTGIQNVDETGTVDTNLINRPLTVYGVRNGIAIDYTHLVDPAEKTAKLRYDVKRVWEAPKIRTKKISTRAGSDSVIDTDPALELGTVYTYYATSRVNGKVYIGCGSAVIEAQALDTRPNFNNGVLAYLHADSIYATEKVGDFKEFEKSKNVDGAFYTVVFPRVTGEYRDIATGKLKKVNYLIQKKQYWTVADNINVFTKSSIYLYNAKDYRKRGNTNTFEFARDSQKSVPMNILVRRLSKDFTKKYRTSAIHEFTAPWVDSIQLRDSVITADSLFANGLEISLAKDSAFQIYGCCFGIKNPTVSIEYQAKGKWKNAKLKVKGGLTQKEVSSSSYVTDEVTGNGVLKITIPEKWQEKKPWGTNTPACLVINTKKGLWAIPVKITE